MPIQDNLFITKGNYKTFALELRTDEGDQLHDLDKASFEFMLKDMEEVEALKLLSPTDVKPDEPDHSQVLVTIDTARSEKLEVGLYRYALQARWPDGRVHEWVFPRVFHVFDHMI